MDEISGAEGQKGAVLRRFWDVGYAMGRPS